MDLPPDVEAVRQKIRSVKTSPSLQGLCCLCNDGVLRSFSSSNVVVDAIPLSNQEIMSSRLLLPDMSQQMVENTFQNIDGHQVPPEKLLNPDDEILPENLRRGSPAVTSEKD